MRDKSKIEDESRSMKKRNKEEGRIMKGAVNSTRAAPKVMPPIYFHGNYNRYKEHNNTV